MAGSSIDSGGAVGMGSDGPGGLAGFLANLRALPGTFRRSVLRHGAPVSDRSRSQAIFSNVFLHLHATRTHIRSLRFTTTLAMGIASLSFFLILVVTGILLMVYYKPSVDQAYASIKDIHFVVPTGRVIRNVHRWAAHLMVITVLIHMARVFFTASYKRPREFNWVVGMILLVVTLGLSFTGYLLPWDQLAYWAITIGANIAGSPRELTDVLGITAYFDPGGFQKRLLLGADNVGQEALIRFYLLHVMVLPLVLVGLLAVHFWRVRKDGGLARPAEEDAPASPEGVPPERAPTKTFGLMCVVRDRTPATDLSVERTVPSWPYLLRAELFVLMCCLLVSMVLALAFDAPLKEIANPSIPENPAKAPWYFLGLQEMVSYSALMGGLVIPAIIVLGLALVPYLDREPEDCGIYFSGPRGRRLAGISLLFGFVAAVLAVAIPVRFGWLREWFPNIPQLVIIAINPGTLLTLAYAVWSLVILKRTGSTRMGAIALFTCFLIGFVVLTIVGVHFRGPNWGFYWTRASWPMH
jgi:quinol-cytochrome oxidoreductase complex cytochrome b subunit